MALTIVTYTEGWDIVISRKLENCPEKYGNIKSPHRISWKKQIYQQKEKPTVVHD